LYFIVFIVLNVTGWLIRPKFNGERFSVQEQTKETADGVKDREQEGFVSETAAGTCSGNYGIDVGNEVNKILIPKIGIEAPLVFPEESDSDFTDDLNRGVVYFPESKLPGEKGEAVFLGHSAPLGWPKIRYDWVFSDLNKLESGDEVYVFFEDCQYVYQVRKKYFLDRGEDLPELESGSQSVLTLISCWPQGKDFRRIAIRAELITNRK